MECMLDYSLVDCNRYIQFQSFQRKRLAMTKTKGKKVKSQRKAKNRRREAQPQDLDREDKKYEPPVLDCGFIRLGYTPRVNPNYDQPVQPSLLKQTIFRNVPMGAQFIVSEMLPAGRKKGQSRKIKFNREDVQYKKINSGKHCGRALTSNGVPRTFNEYDSVQVIINTVRE